MGSRGLPLFPGGVIRTACLSEAPLTTAAFSLPFARTAAVCLLAGFTLLSVPLAADSFDASCVEVWEESASDRRLASVSDLPECKADDIVKEGSEWPV